MATMVSVRIRLVEKNRRAWLNLGLTTAGLLAALFAQRNIYNHQDWVTGALFYAVAFALVFGAWLRADPGIAPAARPIEVVETPTWGNRRVLLVVPAFLFAVVAFWFFGDNRFTPSGVLAWLTGILLFLYVFWERAPGTGWATLGRYWRAWTSGEAISVHLSWHVLALGAVFLLGVFFYFFRLDAVPAEMTSDHAEKILDTYDVLQGERPIFFERNTGREAIQFYLNAAVVALGLAPLDHLALKIATALCGLLTIPGVYLLAREFFDEDVGLGAAFFSAVSIWPVAIARVGLRFPLAPLFVAFSMFFLVRALRRQRRNDFILAGLILGLGLHGYSPFRMAPLVALVWMGLWLLFGKNLSRSELPRYVRNVFLLFATMLLVFLPLLRYSLERPEMFWYRAVTRLTSEEQPIADNPLLIFLSNNWRALQMFNLQGDVVWVNAIPQAPVVDYITGACILMGALYAGYRLASRREYSYMLIFPAIFILFLPSTLSIAFPEENPSVVRAAGAIPFIMTLAALPLAGWYRQMRALGSHGLGVLLLCALALWAIKLNFDLYFIRYDDQFRHTAWNSTEIAAVLREFGTTLGDPQHAYLVSYPHWVDHRAVGIHLGDVHWDNRVMEREELHAQATDPAAKLYVVNKDDKPTLRLLRELYPNGVEKLYKSRTPTREFITFFAPAKGKEPGAPAATEEGGAHPPLVRENFEWHGEMVEVAHSRFDLGQVSDLFDGNTETLARGADANPLVIDVTFAEVRPFLALGLDLASGQYEIQVALYERAESAPEIYKESYRNLPPDPHLEMHFGRGPLQVERIRLEITLLDAPPEPHVHVREIAFR